MYFFDYSFIMLFIKHINYKIERKTITYAFASFIYSIIENIIVFKKLNNFQTKIEKTNWY